jgi:hypothetical protein
MKLIHLVLGILVVSCTAPQRFNPHKICSPGALQVYRESLLKGNESRIPGEMISYLENQKEKIYQCYQEYPEVWIQEKFETCLIVIFDNKGQVEYRRFSSQSDYQNKFSQCAEKTLKQLNKFSNLKNRSILQSYNFY